MMLKQVFVLLWLISIHSVEARRTPIRDFMRRISGGSFTCRLGSTVSLTTYRETTDMRLVNTKTSPSEVCVLWRITSTGVRIPVGRSYDGNNWEAHSGPYATQKFTCSGTTCTTNLPAKSDTERYELVSYQRRALSKDETAARFLEQTTFGPRRDEIRAFPDVTTQTFIQWILNQSNLPITSHRAEYRKRLNHRFPASGKTRVGRVTHPCEAGTRYRRAAFTDKDRDAMVEIKTLSSTLKALSIDGNLRTVINANQLYANAVHTSQQLADGKYLICDLVEAWIGGQLPLQHNGVCGNLFAGSNEIGNPAISLDSSSALTATIVDLSSKVKVVDTEYHDVEQTLLVTVPLSQCTQVSQESHVFGFYNGKYWLHDPRLVIQDNNVENPNAEVCTSAPPTFLNEASCVLAETTPCVTTIDLSDLPSTVDLTVSTLQQVYEDTGKLMYAVSGLRGPWEPPCKAETFSRWVVVAEDCTDASIRDATRSFLQNLMTRAKEKQSNPNILDVFMPFAGCDAADVSKSGYKISANGKCYKNVHPNHWQVFDFSRWADEHPGGAPAIKQFALSGTFMLNFPDWHTMDRWTTNMKQLTNIGRFGDTVTNHPAFKVPQSAPIEGGLALVCGSPFEVANNASLAGSLLEGAFDVITTDNHTTPESTLMEQNLMIWMDVALSSKDQLRQRIAWALSQILVISPSSIEAWYTNELFLTYYDIFVRHAFGNYRDILKEVSYSPAMAEMLSYLWSASTAIIFEWSQLLQYPDENFAREVMQLFSIGLTQLNQDGTPLLDQNNLPMLTYSNDDIMEYARMWTGFKRQPRRNNIEEFPSPWTGSLVDPLMIDIQLRDSLPKMGLNRVYVGDGYPLCVDLPSQHFLKRGATYKLLGPKPKPRLLSDPESWTDSATAKRISLDQNSNLYKALCKLSGGVCSYPAMVVLQSNMACTGVECDIDEPRIVKVSGVYYEYTRFPCVEQSFYSNPTMMTNQWGWSYCADRRAAAGSLVCCPNDYGDADISVVKFDGEKLKFDRAAARCTANGMKLCDSPWWDCNDCNQQLGYWTSHSCSLAVKIHRDGNIGIVHDVADKEKLYRSIHYNVDKETKTSFRVDWQGPLDSFLSSYNTQCASSGCKLDPLENLCICPVAAVTNSAVFSSAPTVNQVLRQLPIGSFAPDILAGSYSARDLGNGVLMHSTDGLFSAKSIFQVTDSNGVTHFRKNVKSTVTVGSGGLSFRNPPHFISLAFPELRDAVYETDAGLDQYFYHPNVAPFLASRMLQRFGQSNPSPRMIATVANAFRSGVYSVGGVNLGSKKYGDMFAMMAAILLDRESRAPILDADPVFGSLQEPFLRYVRTMRSLEFTPSPDSPFVRFQAYLPNDLGQQPHSQPNVFSYFKPEFTPAGPVGNAGLYCPECQLTDGPKAITLMNALNSLLKYGLSPDYGGFGYGREIEPVKGDYSNSFGHLALKLSDSMTASQVVDELALLLTAGRLSSQKRTMMVNAFNSIVSRAQGIITVEQMMLTTPEFHTNSLSQNGGGAVSPPPTPSLNTRPYKAVIYVMLSGGLDSFNMFVPQTCSGKNSDGVTVNQQYMTERGELAIPLGERSLQITATGQPCSTFAIHKDLPLFRTLYNAGDLTFFANTGVLNEVSGIDKVNYMAKTRVQLFAHNWMQQESKTMDPKAAKYGTGVLGRLSSTLKDKGYTPGSVSFDRESISNAPERTKTPRPIVVSPYGVSEFDIKPWEEKFDLTSYAKQLNAKPSPGDSLFGQTWSSRFIDGMNEAQFFQDKIEQAPLGGHWGWDMGHIGYQFRMLSKLVKSRGVRGVDRDVFYTDFGGWDHHDNQVSGLQSGFQELNKSLNLLITELKLQNVWNDVTIVLASEFGRTLTPNSGGGSDHGWGGHYAIMGGDVKGGKVLGLYPTDLTEKGPLNVGRGRFIPTTSWDAVWNGIAQWMGVTTEGELDYCLPNRKATSGVNGFTNLFSRSDLFQSVARNRRLRERKAASEESEEIGTES